MTKETSRANFLHVVLLIPFDYNIDIISYAGHKKHVNGCWEELAV